MNREIAGPGIHIEDVKVVGRHRRDLDDLDSLMESIKNVGLLQPIVVTKDGRLVAGERRLEACKRLGRESINVSYAESLTDAASLLHAERDENVCRKPMLPSEMASLGEALYAIEAERAKERQCTHGGTAPGRCANTPGSQSGSDREPHGEVRDLVGPALGMSGRTYGELRAVHTAATDDARPQDERALAQEALDAMDSGQGIQGAAKDFRRKLRAKRDAQETRDAAMADPEPKTEPSTSDSDENWIPPRGDSSPKAAARRRELIAELAERGYSSTQIGERLGVLEGTIRRIARENDFRIPADEAMGSRTRKKIDSNRIVRETVSALESQEMALGLVNYDDLDRSEIQNWTASLTESIRVLNRLNKRLKEMVQ